MPQCLELASYGRNDNSALGKAVSEQEDGRPEGEKLPFSAGNPQKRGSSPKTNGNLVWWRVLQKLEPVGPRCFGRQRHITNWRGDRQTEIQIVHMKGHAEIHLNLN